MAKYEIGYHMPSDSISIAHRNEVGELVGIRGRFTREEDVEKGKKYAPLYINGTLCNHPLSYNLYGLYNNKKRIQEVKKIVIVEAEKSVLMADSFYGDHNITVATCGSNVSNYQRELILKMGVNEVILGLDKEYDSIESEEFKVYYRETLLPIAKMFTPFCKTYVLIDRSNRFSYKESPMDRGKFHLEQMMKEKLEVRTA